MEERVPQIIATLKAFKKNWDGAKSPAVKAAVIKKLKPLLEDIEVNKLPFPNVVPVPGGGAMLEWHSYHRDAEVEITPTGRLNFQFCLKRYNQDGEVVDTLASQGDSRGPADIAWIIAWFTYDVAFEA